MDKANRTKADVIFNIQKYNVNDGPGIKTVVFFKGCPLRCRWCSNPESRLAKVRILWDHKKCTGCHHCIRNNLPVCRIVLLPVSSGSIQQFNVHAYFKSGKSFDEIMAFLNP